MPNDIQQSLYDFDATIQAHPEYNETQLLQKFPEFGNDRKKLQAAYDYSATLNSGKYKDVNEFNSKFPEFFGGNDAPFYLQKPEEKKIELPAFQNQQGGFVEGFGGGFKQGTKALAEGSKVVAGNIANQFTGSSRDAERALSILEKHGGENYKARSAYATDRQDKYQEDMREYERQMEEWHRKHPNILDRAKSMLPFIGDVPKRPENPNVNSHSIGDVSFVGERANMRAYNLVEKALKASGGDMEKAKAYLTQQGAEKTWGDKVEEAAISELQTLKPTKGAAAWVGNMIPQMIPNALAIGASLHPSTRPLAKPLGAVGMGVLSASSGGSAIADARQYAKDKKMDIPESDILSAGAIATAIEVGTEYIPFSRYMSGAGSMVKRRLGKEVAETIVSNPAAVKEANTLLKKVAKNIPGSVNGKTLKSFAGDITAESLSEFSAESLGTLVPVIYSNEEDYPTLKEIVANGIEGAKGGLFMGTFLGGGSKLANNYAQNQRRRQQGVVTFGDTDNGVVEILGEQNDNFVALDESGEVIDVPKSAVTETATVGWNEFKNFSNELKTNKDAVVEEINQPQRQPDEVFVENIVNPALPEAIDPTDAANHIDTRIGVLNARHVMDEALADVDYTIDERIEMSVEEQKAIVQDVMSNDMLSQEQKQSVINYITAAALDRNLQQAKQARLQEQTAQAAEAIRDRVNETTGTLVTARIKGAEGNPVQVTKGLALRENPTPTLPQGEGVSLDESGVMFEIDVENSDKDKGVYYIDENGKTQVTVAENLDFVSSEEVETAVAQMTAMMQQQEAAQQMEIEAAVEAYLSEGELAMGRWGELETGREGDEAIMGQEAGDSEITAEEAEKAAFMESLPVIKSGKEAGEYDTERFTPEQNLKYFEYEYGKDEALSAAEKKAAILNKNIQKEAKMLENDPFNIRQKRKVEAMREELKAYSDYVFAEKEARTAKQIAESTPTSVLEAREQQSEAIQQHEAGKTGTASAVVSEKWNTSSKQTGIEDIITLANGEKIQGVYVLTDAFAPSPSHDINHNFGKTEGFPVNEQGKTVNDRDYEADQTAQTLVQQRANQYDERAVQTPVVVSSEGVVLSGNDRTMSGQLAAQQGTDGAYVDYITKYADRWGFTPEQIASVQHPRIVFVPNESMPYNTATFAKFNAEEKKTQNSLESAIKASKSLSKEVVMPLSGIVEQFDKLNDLYNNPQATKKAIGVLLQNGVIGTNEVPRLMDGDLLSQEGRSYFETLMLGSVLDEAALREADKMRSVRQTLMRAMPQLLRNAALKDYSLISELNNAIHLLYEAKQTGSKVELQLMQGNLFEASTEEIYSEVEKVLAIMMENEKDTEFRRIFDVYNGRAADTEAGQIDIFDGILSKSELLQQILNSYGQETDSNKQTGTPSAIDTRSEESGTQSGTSGENINQPATEQPVDNNDGQPTDGQQLDRATSEESERGIDVRENNENEIVPRKYNTLDHVTINGEEHTISEAGTYVGTNDHFYTIEKDGEVTHEDISQEELEALIERKVNENKDVKEDKESGQPIDIIAHARNVVKNEELRREGAEGTRREGDKETSHFNKGGKVKSKTPISQKSEPKSPNTPVAEKIEDFGEKIGGARKDLAQEYRTKLSEIKEDDIRSKPLSKIFPRLDLKKLVENGDLSQDDAIYLNYRYDKIPVKPRNTRDFLQQRKLSRWIKDVQQEIEIARTVLEEKGEFDNLERLKGVIKSQNAGYRYYQNSQPIDVTPEQRLRLNDDWMHIETLKALGFPTSGVKMGNAKVQYSVSSGERFTVTVNNKRSYYESFDDAIEYLKSELANPTKRETVFNVYQNPYTGKFYIGRPVQGKEAIRLSELFDSSKEAFAYLKNSRDEIQNKWDAINVKPEERRTENRERKGRDWRDGKDISPDAFQNEFGFRGVEFGNWVNQEERQKALNDAYDGFMDLADVLKISPKALSLNGELAMAFGARGTGSAGGTAAAAHYEPLKVVINLTKKQGAGSLAHEWWHALDNYFSRMGDDSIGYATDGTKRLNENVRQEMKQAFADVMTAIKKSELLKRSEELDKIRSKPYWASNIEMSARSFENYVNILLSEKGDSNDYLVNFKELGAWVSSGAFEGDTYPYPTQEESHAINEKFQQFFDTVQEKVDEAGNVALFQSSGKFEKATPKELQQLLDLLKKTGLANDVRTGQEFWDKLNSLTGDEVFKQGAKDIENINNTFNAELQQQIDGTLPKGHVYKLGVAEGILNAAGFPMLPIELASSRLSDKAMQENHPFDLSEIVNLPKAIHSPLAILDSKTQAGSKVIITNLTDTKGNNFVVAMRTNVPRGQYGSTIQINQVRSIYPKDNIADVINWINRGDLLRYADKTKTIEWITQQQSNSADVDIRPMDFKVAANIIQNFENPTVSEENRFHAVWHGSPHAFDKFSLSKIGTGEGVQAYGYGLYFTDKEGIARNYAKDLSGTSIKHLSIKGLPLYKNSATVDYDYRKTGEHVANLQEQLLLQEQLFKQDVSADELLKEVQNFFDEEIKYIEQDAETDDYYKGYLDVLRKYRPEKTSDIKLDIDKTRNLYKVKIHGDKTIEDLNFVRYDKPLTESQTKAISEQSQKEGVSDFTQSDFDKNGEWLMIYLVGNAKLTPKESSEFLLRAGIDGIQYPTEFQTKGEHEEAFNYVVFDENALEIEEHIQFLKRPDGTVYGFVDSDNVIYLNPDEVNLNTPIHEYGHLWVSHIKESYPDLYERAEEVFAHSPYMQEVKADPNYSHLNEEQQLDEAISRAIGDKGESGLTPNPSPQERGEVKDIGMYARIKNWINDVWKRIGAAFGVKNLTPDQISRLTWQDITDMGVSELLGGEKLGSGRPVTEVGRRKFNEAVFEQLSDDFYNAKNSEEKADAAGVIIGELERVLGNNPAYLAETHEELIRATDNLTEEEKAKIRNGEIYGLYDRIDVKLDIEAIDTVEKLISGWFHENGHRILTDKYSDEVFEKLYHSVNKQFLDSFLPEFYRDKSPAEQGQEIVVHAVQWVVENAPLEDVVNNDVDLSEMPTELRKFVEEIFNTLYDERVSNEKNKNRRSGLAGENDTGARTGDNTPNQAVSERDGRGVRIERETRGDNIPSTGRSEVGDDAIGRQGDDIRFRVGEKPKYTNQPVGDFAQENARFNAVDRISDIKDAAKADEVRAKLADIERRMEDLNRLFSRNEVSRDEYAKQKSALMREESGIYIEIKDLTGGWKKAKGEGQEKRIVAPREVGLQQKIELQQGYERAAMRKYAQEIAQAARNSQIEEEVSAGVLAAENTRVQQIIAEIEAMDKNEEIVPIDRRETNWLEIAKQRASAKRQQENLPKIKQAAKDIKDLIDTAIGKDIVDMMSERDFKSLINRLETATSTGSLKAAVKAINQSIMRITLRKNNEIINGLIDGKIVNTHAIYSLNAAIQSSESVSGELGDAIDDNIFRLLSGINAYNRYFEIQGKSKRGVSVAKNVDENTREILQFVRDNRDVSREQLVKLQEEQLQGDKEGYTYTEGDGRKMLGIELLCRLQDIRDIEADIKTIRTTDFQEFNRENPDKWKWEGILERQGDLEKVQMTLIREFTDLIELGRSRLAEWKEAEAARNREIATEAIAAVKDNPIKNQGEEKRQTNWERMKEVLRYNKVNEFLLTPLGSFNFMLKYIDRNHIMGEGTLYNRFMKGKESVSAAKQNYYDGWGTFKQEAAQKTEEIFGMKFKDVIADSRKDSGAVITYKLFDKKSENGELEAVTTTAPMTKGELMYIYMTWQQAEGREKLENMDINQSVIDDIADTLGKSYITYADWVQKEFLPSRRVKYNETHKRVFGTSMAEVKNYFPLKYDAKQHVKPVEIGTSVDFGLPSTMTGAIINRIRNKKDIALDANAFDLLMENGQEMEEWSAYAQLRKDMNALLSNRYFKNLVDANDKTAFAKLKESAQIALRAKKDKVLDAESLAGNINRKLAGAAIALRLNTALKQVMSYPAFMTYSLNPKFKARLINNAMPYMYYANYRWAMNNLPGFKERVSSGVFGNEKLLDGEWRTSEQVSGRRKLLGRAGVKVDDFFNSMIKIGMKPNQIMDTITISAGAKAIYDLKIEVYKKQGMDAKEAHERAVFDAAIAANETQQSAEEAYLSPIQSTDTLFARGMTTFMNANFGYLRKHAEGILQVARSKKHYETLKQKYEAAGLNSDDAHSKALGEVLHAGGKAVLNQLVFGVMMNTIWKLAERILWGTGDDDDEEKAETIKAIATGPIANVMGGSMITGVIDGYEPKDLLSSEVLKAYRDIKKAAAEDGYISMEVAMVATKSFMRFGTGFNFDVWKNIYDGYEKGIKEKGGAAMAYQYFTNVPQSIRIETAKKIKEGESLADYAHRVSLAYENEKRFEREMNSIILKYAFNDAGDMTQFNRAYEMAKEWEKLKKDPDKKPERYKELEKINRNDALSDLSSYVSKRLKSYKKDLNRKRSDEDMKEAYATVRGLVEKINKEGGRN